MKTSTKIIAVITTAAVEIAVFAWLASGHNTREGALTLMAVSAVLVVISCIPSHPATTGGSSAPS
jgi:hypothetical protein